MRDSFGNASGGRSKAQELADAINRILLTLVTRCTSGQEVRNYFDIGLVGYRGDDVESVFQGTLANRDLVPISELATAPLRLEDRTRRMPDGAGGTVDEAFRLPIWLEPVHNGGTPMCKGLGHVASLLRTWVSGHRQSYPPTLIHVTDGESTDGDPTSVGTELQKIATDAGPLTFFNLHLSAGRATPVTFPESEGQLFDGFAKTLFKISSVLPESIRQEALADGYTVTDQSRAFAFNADLVEAVRFLQIGTRTSVSR